MIGAKEHFLESFSLFFIDAGNRDGLLTVTGAELGNIIA